MRILQISPSLAEILEIDVVRRIELRFHLFFRHNQWLQFLCRKIFTVFPKNFGIAFLVQKNLKNRITYRIKNLNTPPDSLLGLGYHSKTGMLGSKEKPQIESWHSHK